MSTVTAVPLQPIKRGSVAKLVIGIVLLVTAAVLLAGAGAGRMVAVTVKTVTKGTGPLIGPNDGVLIEYTGRLTNGTVIDSTQGRGPAPLLVGQVVPGFSTALQRMQSGGRYKIHIPAKLGYGASSPPGSPIPPNSDLNFDIHVVQVVKDAALMAAAQAGQPQPH
ncbi:MAG: FKBP-type peptidyl-prolyl cis-trans isomerase [Sphingomicrobium sp.]